MSVLYWKRDPAALPPPPGPQARGKRDILGGALLDLDAVQALLWSGNFDLDALWFATSGARLDRDKYRWSSADVLQMLLALKGPTEDPSDYMKSEWCEVDGEVDMRWVACDVYRMHYDLARGQRNPRGTELYLKFSVESDGTVAIVVASCHPSR